MSNHVCNLAATKCSMGLAPSVLLVLPKNQMLTSMQPAANIMDNIPITNVVPFGMCQSLANPTVATATTAAMGVLTPMPCVPVLPAPWVVGAPTVLLANMPSLDKDSKLMCMWAGVITIEFEGQATHQIP